MTVQMGLQEGSVHKWLRRGTLVALWLVATIVMAWATPFAVLAMFAAITGALGATSDTAREVIVSLATLNQAEWAAAGGYWRGFAWLCATILCAWRVLRARPVENACGYAMARVSAVIEPLYVAAGRWFARTDRRVKVVIALLPIASILLAFFAQEGQRSHEQRSRATPAVIALPNVVATPPTSAAISFSDGSILAGTVHVERQSDGRFVLEFDPIK